jgi:hypothetical protein
VHSLPMVLIEIMVNVTGAGEPILESTLFGMFETEQY